MGPKTKRSQKVPGSERTGAPFSNSPPIPSQGALTQKRGGEEVGGGGKMDGGCGKVTFVITDLTVGPDGCRGWTIYVGWGGASQEEALTNCGRQSPPEGIPLGW